MTQADRDAAYNNAAAVADSATLNGARIAASLSYRNRPGTILDLKYGSGARQAWDLFPAADPGAPCLVFIHGGYWQMNRREDFAILAEGLVSLGWSVAMPGYSLAPEARLAEIAIEIRRALDWLADDGHKHGIAGPILLSGWSAGAHLAALALDHPAVAAGLALAGIYELAPLRETYLNAKLNLSDAEIARLSPIRLPAINKPLVIAYGTDELPALIAQSRNFAAYRDNLRAPTTLIPVEGANHFTLLDTLRRADGVLARHACSLMVSRASSDDD